MEYDLKTFFLLFRMQVKNKAGLFRLGQIETLVTNYFGSFSSNNSAKFS